MATSDVTEISAEEKIVFSVRSHFTEEEYKRIVYRTRERERHIRALLLLSVAVLSTVIGLCADKHRMIFCALFMLICIGYNYVNPLMITNKHVKHIKEKYGSAEHITECAFTDDGVKIVFEKWGVATYAEYHQITRLYVKNGWLFFCGENLRGFYIKCSEEFKTDGLVSFIKEKNPSVKIIK